MSDAKTEIVNGEVVDHSHDKVFFLTFGGVLSFLVGLTFIISIIAGSLASSDDDELDPVLLERIAMNTAPIGSAYTDASAIPAEPAKTAAVTRSVEQVVSGVCGACHAAGVLGATKLDDKAGWQERIASAGGVDALVASALAGKGSMPPKGGDSSLSDAELEAAVRAILDRVGL